MDKLKFYSVNDPEFVKYGRVIDLDTSEIIAVAEKIPYPEQGTFYKPDIPELRATYLTGEIKNFIFGELDTQAGYCWGRNNMLNAMEWHFSSEVNVAVTDLVLILGSRADIENNKIDSSKFQMFLLKKGTCVEIYGTTLHYCPCQTRNDGFGCIVFLPVGTNTPLDREYNDKLLFRKNKWLLCHQENKALIDKGVIAGICGENYVITEDMF